MGFWQQTVANMILHLFSFNQKIQKLIDIWHCAEKELKFEKVGCGVGISICFLFLLNARHICFYSHKIHYLLLYFT
jgi:hypothetical protein